LELGRISYPEKESGDDMRFLNSATRFIDSAFFLLVISLIAALAAPSWAANWTVDLYGDVETGACSISYSEPTLIQVHMVHDGDTPAFGLGFAVYPPDCMIGATWITDFINDTSDRQGRVGSTVDPYGLIVIYGNDVCIDMPHHIGYAWYLVTNPAVLCCDFVVSKPTLGQFIGFECVYQEWPLQAGKKLRINPDDTCPCDGPPVSNRETTWGGIKALYR
jgi:hypothetical protein